MNSQVFRSHLNLLILAITLVYAPDSLNAQSWRIDDMSPSGLSSSGTISIVDVQLLPGKTNCGEPECKFVLHYFGRESGDSIVGKVIRFVSDRLANGAHDQRKTILYVIGGPGQIVNRQPRELEFLEDKYKVIYFDMRGTGLSVIPLKNSYDRFLRARHIVEDIEILRQKVLREEPWDAIFAHSYGTIIAQMYAAHPIYGARVKKLILSAPISRNVDFEDARINMIAANLRSIYQSYSSTGCGCDAISLDRPFPGILTPGEIFGNETRGTDNFCFLKDPQINRITEKLQTLLKALKKDYGSASFVLGNFDHLIDRSKYFQDHYPYPKVFYRALRDLQFIGAADKNLLFSNENRKQRLVNLGYLLGYFLTLPDSLLKMPEFYDVRFPKAAPFFKQNIEGYDENPVCSSRYIDRIRSAKVSLDTIKMNRSTRANSVLGIFDGSSQWIFHTLKSGLVCFTGKEIKDYVNLPRDERGQIGHQLLSALGPDLDAKICPWNAKDNVHDVPTLILRGGADPITSGCQAEFFLNNGLTRDKRVLIKLRKMGHNLMPTVKREGEKLWWAKLAELVGTFIDSSNVADFRENANIKSILKYPLDAIDQTPQFGGQISYQSCDIPT